MMKNRLILASRSPRRSELLSQLGFEYDIIPSRVEEDSDSPESPREQVIRLAEAKAANVGGQYPGRWVIAADTVVFIDGFIFGKPKDPQEALDMLNRLSGREHSVLSGFAVRHFEKDKGTHQVVETAVKMKPLIPAEMRWYVNTGEPFDKAGGYAIQGMGAFMIESIRGSYTNVVGLPLCELIEALSGLGAITVTDRGFRIAD
jgi:septum formation protein